VKRDASDSHYLNASRIATLFWGAYAIVTAQFALNLGSLIEAVNQLGSFFYGGLIGIFLLAFTQLWSEQFAAANDSFELTIAVSRRFGDSTHRLRSLVYRSISERRLGHVAEVRRLTEEACELMRQIGSEEYVPLVLAQKTWLAWKLGDSDVQLGYRPLIVEWPDVLFADGFECATPCVWSAPSPALCGD
jgi:hypothetical protein